MQKNNMVSWKIFNRRWHRAKLFYSNYRSGSIFCNNGWWLIHIQNWGFVHWLNCTVWKCSYIDGVDAWDRFHSRSQPVWLSHIMVKEMIDGWAAREYRSNLNSTTSRTEKIISLCIFQPFIAENAQLEIREINRFLDKAFLSIEHYLANNLRWL